MLISPDGKQAVGLYTDKFPWKEFGPLEVTRATEIEFDAEKQKWLILLIFNRGEEKSFLYLSEEFDSREDALQYEREFLNERIGELNPWKMI
jgi:hypothetical protein